MNSFNLLTRILLSIVIITACEKKELESPFELGDSNIVEIQIPEKPKKSIIFGNSITVGGSDEKYYSYINKFDVDDYNRIYISGETLDVFDSEGKYSKTLGRKGRGPGEFQAIHDFSIMHNRIYVLDASLYRISIFSIDNLKLLKTIDFESPTGMRSFGDFEVLNDSTFIIGFRETQSPSQVNFSTPNLERFYYKLDKSGKIFDDYLFKTKIKGTYSIIKGSRREGGFIPNSRTTLVTYSDDEDIYLAWTEDIDIKILNITGEEVERYFYDYENYKIENGKIDQRLMESIGENYPVTYPVLNSFFVDSGKRIWVSIYTNDPKIFKWYVIMKNGVVLSEFEWSSTEVFKFVKNNILFSDSFENGGVVVKKHEIEFIDNN